MEGMSTVWSYHESIDELKQRLLYTTYELETARMNATEEMRKNDENVKQLLHLLKVAWQERDEARDQLQRLLNKVMPSSPTDNCMALPHLQCESPHVKPTKANSSITESDSLSETYNHHSYGSPPVDSFFNAASSPDLSNVNVIDSSKMGLPHQAFVQESNGVFSSSIISSENGPTEGIISSGTTKFDRSLSVIDDLAKGKPLPPKGRLLQAVMETGPLLQTLLVSGPLPQWRNPPPPQPLQIPPFSMKNCVPVTNDQKPIAHPNHQHQTLLSPSYFEISSRTSEIHPTVLSFTSG